MAGANYMGGKRNAAKARIKDTATRTQKRFFGRKRLEILGKHLEIGSGRPKSPEKTQKTLKDVLSGMNLAHARRQATLEAVEPLETVHRADPCISFFPKTKGSALPSSPRSSSKIIQALDSEQLEQMPHRAQLDRLLQFPDLAGLADCKRLTTDATTSPPDSSRKRTRKLSSVSDASNDRSKKTAWGKSKSSNPRKAVRNLGNRFSSPTESLQHLPTLKNIVANACVPPGSGLASIDSESDVAEDMASDLGSTCETELPDISWTADGDRFMYNPFQSALPGDDLMLDLDSSLPRASSSPHAADTRDFRTVFNPADRIPRKTIGSSFKSPCNQGSKTISRVPLSALVLNTSLSHVSSFPPRSQTSVDDFSPAMTTRQTYVHITSLTPLKIPGNSPVSSVPEDYANRSENTERLSSSSHSSNPEPPRRYNGPSSSAVSAELNVLDDPDPWHTIGELLDLKPVTDHNIKDEPVWTYDRRGVGYTGSRTEADASPTLLAETGNMTSPPEPFLHAKISHDETVAENHEETSFQYQEAPGYGLFEAGRVDMSQLYDNPTLNELAYSFDPEESSIQEERGQLMASKITNEEASLASLWDAYIDDEIVDSKFTFDCGHASSLASGLRLYTPGSILNTAATRTLSLATQGPPVTELAQHQIGLDEGNGTSRSDISDPYFFLDLGEEWNE